MAYTAGFSVNVGDPTKATDVSPLAANDAYLKAAVDAIMADAATPTSALKNGVTATTQSSGDNSTKVATTAYVDASSTDPGGSNTQIQFNNSGSFGGSANLVYSEDSSDVGLGVGGGNPHSYSTSDAIVLIGSTSHDNTELALASSDTGGSVNQITFSDSADTNYQARMYYNHATGDMGIEVEDDIIISTNSSERLRVLEAGGLTFNGDTAAANALDDYEEGSFTPLLGAHSSDGTHSYTPQLGSYTKIGNKVSIWLKLAVNTLNTSGTISGNLEIRGLPFASANITSLAYVGPFLPVGLDFDGGTGPIITMGVNQTKFGMVAAVDNASYDTFTSADVASGDEFWCQLTYFVS